MSSSLSLLLREKTRWSLSPSLLKEETRWVTTRCSWVVCHRWPLLLVVGRSSRGWLSQLIRLSCRSLSGTQSLPPNYSNNSDPPQPRDHERLAKVSRKPSGSKIKITQESADSVMVTKPRSYPVKPGQVGETLTRNETNNDDVDAHAGNYINQVREKINGNHVNQ